MTIEFFTNVNYVMKLRFVTDERTNGDIEALADAMRALKNPIKKYGCVQRLPKYSNTKDVLEMKRTTLVYYL